MKGKSDNDMESIILSKSKNVLKTLFLIDICFLILSLFTSNKSLLMTSLAINVLMIGSYLVLQKYYMIFEIMIQSQKISKSLNRTLNKLNG